MTEFTSPNPNAIEGAPPRKYGHPWRGESNLQYFGRLTVMEDGARRHPSDHHCPRSVATASRRFRRSVPVGINSSVRAYARHVAVRGDADAIEWLRNKGL